MSRDANYGLVAMRRAADEAPDRVLYVEWTGEEMQTLRVTFERAKASIRGDLTELTLWYAARSWYLSDIPTALGSEKARAEMRRKIKQDYILPLDASIPKVELETVRVPTRFCRMHVGDAGVWWSADEKYGRPLLSWDIPWARALGRR